MTDPAGGQWQGGPRGYDGPSPGYEPRAPWPPYGPHGAPPYDPYGGYGAPPYGPHGAPAFGPYGPPGPYGGSAPPGGFPAGLQGVLPAPPGRPAAVVTAFVLQLLCAVPWLLGSLAIAVALPLIPDVEPAGSAAIPVVFVGVALFALCYLIVSILAFNGRGWARIVVAVLSGLAAVFWLIGTVAQVGPTATAAGVLPTIIGLVLTVAAAALLFVPSANAWYRGQELRAAHGHW